MGRIESIFAELRASGRKALMPFVCGGHPMAGATGEILLAMQEAGASAVEIGIPFSDPIADGPVIAAAMHRALEMGVTPGTILEEVSRVRERLRIGLIAMVSVSILQKLAETSSPRDVATGFARAGFDGFIIPDLPLEESEVWRSAAADAGLTMTFLIAPGTPPERAQRIARASTGFVYLLARAGITGERSDLPDLAPRIAELRKATELPIAIGFGISSAEHVKHVTAHADAAIVGSALVRRLGEAPGGQSPAAVAREFCGQLTAGLG